MLTVELSDAGEGTVEIVITGPNGQLIPHQVVTVEECLLEVHYTPTTTGNHQATVTYNGACVPGCLLLLTVCSNDVH